jgi:hypothetical protein
MLIDLRELLGKNIFFVTSPNFEWDSIKRCPIDIDRPRSLDYKPSSPSSHILVYEINEKYMLDEGKSISTFLDTYGDCNVVIYLNYDDLYWGQQPDICPHCGQTMPKTTLYLQFWIEPISKRKAKLKKLINQ